METMINNNPNADVLPSASHDNKPMLADGNFYRPIRVQRKRTKGWKMPENTVYVGRPTKYGNPFIANFVEPISNLFITNEMAVGRFESYFNNLSPTDKEKIIEDLKGKNLACFCPLDKPCHADFLLEIVNAE